MELKELINACIDCDAVAQKELYGIYASKIYGSCLRYARNYDDAQDILQESFITIFKKLDSYGFKGSFEGWCKRITVNTALMRYRSEKVYQLHYEDQLEDIDTVVEDDSSNIDLDTLLEFIQQLPDKYRICFTMFVIDGYSHKEIASIMEISEGTSKSNVARARNNLKDLVQRWYLKNNSSVS